MSVSRSVFVKLLVKPIQSSDARNRYFSAASKQVVNSHNEFDPLEEVIVGRVEGATIPEWHVSGKAVWPPKHWDMYKSKKGQAFPPELMMKGNV